VLLAVTLAMFGKGIVDPASIVHEDAAGQFQPFYQYVADEVHAGRFPHWCPHVSGGVPLHDALHGAVLYPLRWPLFWMDYCQGYVASLIVHFFLGALFTYLFLRATLRCSPPASVIGAMSFAFGGFTFGHVTHWNYFQAYPWFVLTIILFARALGRPLWRRAVVASVPVALIGLAGAVHLLLILGLGLGLWGAGETIVRGLRCLRRGRLGRARRRPGAMPLRILAEGHDRKGVGKKAEEEEEETAHGQDAHATHGRDARGTHGQDGHATNGRDGHATKQGTFVEVLWPVAAFVVVCVLGGLIASAQLWPGQLQSELSTRGASAMSDDQRWEFITEMCVEPLPTAERMVVPFLYGNSRLGYWGQNNYHETTFYAGIIPLLAAVIGLGAWRTNRWVPRLAVFGVVMLVLSAGRFGPVFRLLYDLAPGFDRLRNPARIFAWVQFCIACLAAIGIDRGLAAMGRPLPRHLRIVAAAAGALAILALAGGLAAIATVRSADSWGRHFVQGLDRVDETARQEKMAALEEMGRKVIDEKDALTWAGAAAGAVSAGAAAGFFALAGFRKRWSAGVLVALLALDLGLASTGMLHWSNRLSALNRAPDQVRFLQEHLGTQRYAALEGDADEETGLNRCMQFRIACVRTTDPGIFFTSRQQALVDWTARSRRVRDLVGTKYLVGDRKFWEPNVSAVYRTGDVVVYRNDNAFPLAFLARRVEALADANAVVWQMAVGATDLRDVALVEQEAPPLSPPKPNEPAGEVADIQTVPGEYRMRTQAEGGRQLVLTVTFHPEWKCAVDGNETPIYETDLGFMSARVPAGAHEVKWWFDPEWFRMGLAGTVAGLMIAVGVLGAAPFTRKRGKPETIASKTDARRTEKRETETRETDP
jgi:hypothetical protein